jgi:NifU-like protein involved in Fe-S cluster formation
MMEHFQSPANRGAMEQANAVGRGSLDGYPPFLTVYLRIGDKRVADAAFEADGCGVTIACGSMVTELVKGRSRVECRQITAETLAKALDGIPIEKEHCAAVAISALHDAIRSWQQSSSAEVD